MVRPPLHLQGFSFEELFTSAGLRALDARFLAFLNETNPVLYADLIAYRVDPVMEASESLPQKVSQLIIDCAPILEIFLAQLFSITDAVMSLQKSVERDNPIFAFKKHFVLREAKRALKQAAVLPTFAVLDAWLTAELAVREGVLVDREWAVAHYAAQHPESAERLIAWCVQALVTPEGQAAVAGWVSFHLPAHLDYSRLVDVERSTFRHRDGFKLTDTRMSARAVLDEVHYCVYCHKTDGDFCSKGFPLKKNDPDQGFKTNPLGEILTGCPLEEKISEMHFLKKCGFSIAALATVMIDNPLCPVTGHRICNDCMKACIYQKQEPVDIPQIETRVLMDVLLLPWGVEIYDLLVRWNPLRKTQWVAKPYNGKKILVMGMGPAGFTLAHHLLMEGFAVVGADGLKIEPLPLRYIQQPIYSYESITEALDERIMTGFGGVAEYGITVRWDKNFLKLIYLTLMRRPYFQVYGSVRFGGTIRVEDAWNLGFDHVAMAVGAGLPRELRIPHSLAPGMRQANDFLMALQLTGAAKASSLANLQVRLPSIVIGGGLTAIDTATEVQAYYLVQIERVYARYMILVAYEGEMNLRARFTDQDLMIIDEFIEHARVLHKERARAVVEKRLPDLVRLLRAWGGVTVVYRRTLQASPAYQRNYQEVEKALEEGIYYLENLEPTGVRLDDMGHVSGLICDPSCILEARSIFVATGATPNIAYSYEHRDTFLREGKQYIRFNADRERVTHLSHCKDKNFGPFTSYVHPNYPEHRVSFLGDTHPVFHGSVVKAMASAKQVYPFITRSVLMDGAISSAVEQEQDYVHFKQYLMHVFQATIDAVIRRSDNIVELMVRAPMAARHFQPGQFYRVQNYETGAQKISGLVLQTEAMALLAARSEKDPDVLSFLILERDASSRLVAFWKIGEPLAVMGPTGVKTKIPVTPETVLILGGHMAMIELRAIAPAFRAQGHRLLFIGCDISMDDQVALREEVERAADHVLWINGSEWESSAKTFLLALGYPVDRVIVVGSGILLQQVQAARSGLLQDVCAPETKFFGSVFGAMQCMLKGVCAQCLQWQVDPVTRQRTKAVYACSWQQQPLEIIDTHHIQERLAQNQAIEQLTHAWLDYVLATSEITDNHKQ